MQPFMTYIARKGKQGLARFPSRAYAGAFQSRMEERSEQSERSTQLSLTQLLHHLVTLVQDEMLHGLQV